MLLAAIAPLPALATDPLQPAPVALPTEPLPSPLLPAPDLSGATLFLPSPSVPKGEAHLLLRLSERRLYRVRNGVVLASYPVAVGRADWQTPTGTFAVFQKRSHPAWEHPFTGTVVPPGPDNPLGARWIGFWSDGHHAIGFHGTPQADLIGQAVSHGCVRLRNEDIIALYEQVSLGTRVVVVP